MTIFKLTSWLPALALALSAGQAAAADPQLTGITGLTTGSNHTCALTTSGAVKCWGGNWQKQLGDSSSAPNRTVPHTVPALPGAPGASVTAISSGSARTCGLTPEGGVKCWGELGYMDPGVVAEIGGLGAGPGAAVAKALSVSGEFYCALTVSGVAKCWGANWYGNLGDGTTIFRSEPSEVSALVYGELAAEVASVSVGSSHACALTTGGAVRCWGDNFSGGVGDGSSENLRLMPVRVQGLESGVAGVFAQSRETCAVTQSGTVKCWGTRNAALGNGSTNARVVPVEIFELSATGNERLVSIVYGYEHSCGLTVGGAVKCWGGNTRGQLGDGTTTSRQTPANVPLGEWSVTALDAGSNHTCALLADGTVKCWGANDQGQLGDGTLTDRWSPTPVSALELPGVPEITGAVAGAESAAISFNTPASGGSTPLTGYIVECTLPGTHPSNSITLKTTGSASPLTVPSMRAGATYFCTVSAQNSTGIGSPSAALQVTPLHTMLTLGVAKTGAGLVTSAPAGISCGATSGATCSAQFAKGSSVTLSATADAGYRFTGWGGACAGHSASATCPLTIYADTDVSAQFEPTLVVAKSGLGTVTSDPKGIECGADCSALFAPGTQVTLRANADFGGSFTGWSGACTGSGSTCTLTFNGVASVGASFASAAVAPGAPAITSATPGAGRVALSFSAPAPNGGALVSGYSATCSADGQAPQSATAAASPIIVQNLKDGTPTFCTVTAVNSAGSGAPSAALAVTPGAKPDALGAGTVTLAAGTAHTCALDMDGAVQCWGDNSVGQLGDGTTINRVFPVAAGKLPGSAIGIAADSGTTCVLGKAGAVHCLIKGEPAEIFPDGSGVTAISAGGGNGCALKADGTAACWSLASTATPTALRGIEGGVVALSHGRIHTCLLTTGGAVKCWGGNTNGQLGDGTRVANYGPVAVSGLSSGVAAISAGPDHTCALTTAGGVKCWGANDDGALGDGSRFERTAPVDVSGLTGGVVAIAASKASAADSRLVAGNFTCALLADGSVKCWGAKFGRVAPQDWANQGGDLTPQTVPETGGASAPAAVASIVAGGSHACALGADGKVSCWGNRANGRMGDGKLHGSPTALKVGGLQSGVAALAAGWLHTCALTTTGGIKCWGDNSMGQLGDQSTNQRAAPVDVAGFGPDAGGTADTAKMVAVATSHSCALTVAGAVKCWGGNSQGQLGDGTRAAKLMPQTVPGLESGVQAIAAGGLRTCALDAAGGVKCWGGPATGSVFTGPGPDVLSPTVVPGLEEGVSALSVSDSYACAVTKTGAAKCWGMLLDRIRVTLRQGRLWTETARGVESLGAGVAALAPGGNQACALTNQGTLKCWGETYNDYYGTPTLLPPANLPVLGGQAVTAISSGNVQNCALLANGGVTCTGGNAYGQLGDGTTGDRRQMVAVHGISGATAVAAGGAHTCALANGGVFCWGDNNSNQLGNGESGIASAPIQTVAGPAVPLCSLTASAQSVASGTPVTLAATCSPAPDAYLWSNAALGRDQATGVVRPFFSGDYSIQASNGGGTGPAATVSIKVGDTLALRQERSQYRLTVSANVYTLSPFFCCNIYSVTSPKRIRFADVSLAFDLEGTAGQTYRLYQAAFNRVPDQGGLGFQMSAIEVFGMTLAEVARNFINSPEFASTYGVLDDLQFVTRLYTNVLQRTPEAEGLKFYLDGLTSGTFTRAQVLAGISESPENKALVLPAIKDGIQYVPLYDEAGNSN